MNHIIKILHSCANKWDGWANRAEGDKFLFTWKLPDIEENDSEEN
jgi:hypothetical protein